MTNLNYLEYIGIKKWRAKRPLLGAKKQVQFESYQLFQRETLKGFLLIETVFGSPKQNQQAQVLTDNILNTINLHKVKIENLNWQEIKPYFVLIFGQDLANNLKLDSNHLISTYHPLQLLQNPKLKTKVWQDIKALSEI